MHVFFTRNMSEEIFSILKNTLSITFFVLAMMLFIEFINVKTSGSFCKKIQKKGWQQLLIGILFGILPGCLGTYTVVTLFSHNLVSLGTLFATFVATMGDEAFFIFSLDIKTALLITIILVFIGLLGGCIIDLFTKTKEKNLPIEHFEIHNHDQHIETEKPTNILDNLQKASPHRAMLLFGILLILTLSILGEIGHSHDIMPLEIEHNHEHHIDWFSITFILISIISAYVVCVVSEHFLEKHFWNHIIKKHFFKIFGWTLCIITIIHVLTEYIDLQYLVDQYHLQILIVAILIGLIPESGPHIIFISLFLSGSIPLSVLLANSLVQDGHGGLPLFAENKMTFVFLKLSKAIIALIIGILGFYLGF